MSFDGSDERWAALLREGAEATVPEGLDRRVRALLRTMPLAERRFASPLLALGLALAATLATTTAVASWLSAAGAGDSGVSIAAMLVAGYLGLSAVASLPLLLRLKASRRRVEVEA